MLNTFNTQLFFLIHSVAGKSTFTDGLIVFCAKFLPWIIIGIVVVLIVVGKLPVVLNNKEKPLRYFITKTKSLGRFLGTAFIAWIGTSILKRIIFMPRPFIRFENIHPLFVHGSYDSFPSGHAAFFATLAILIHRQHRGWGRVFLFGALLVGVARIMAGVHTPIDILGGYVLGMLIAFLFRSK